MLKCPNEARGMFVADCESDLFDAHVALSKKMRGFLQASFGKQPCHADPHVLLEKVLEIGGAQVDFNRQIVNREQCSGFDQFDDLAQAGRRIHCGSIVGNLGKNSTANVRRGRVQPTTVRLGGNAISTRVPASGALLIRNCA